MAMEEMSMYGGKVTLRFDPNRHVYRVDGKWIPGCTSISGFMDHGKSEALKRWALKMGLNYLATQLEAGKSYDEIELAEMFEAARKEPFKRTKKAADIGSVTHDYAEAYIKHQLKEGPKPKLPINKMAKQAAENFLIWAKTVDEWIYAERKVVSLEHWYAGTVDIVAIVGGKLTVGDLKTSNYLSAEHLLQTAGYQIALEEEFEDKFENRVILHLDKEAAEIKVYDLNALAGTLIQLTPWSKIRFNTWEQDKGAFLGLREAFRTVRGG
jgi:CRISPR/Cas system-associated exonuclease Cas4 (RecB family)